MARRGDSNESAFTARVMQAAQYVKAAGFEDVAAWMAKRELAERKPRRASKRKVRLSDRNGVKLRGGDLYIDGRRLEGNARYCPMCGGEITTDEV